jgi:hypothetical protein
VSDTAEVVPEAYELVEHGLIGADDLRDFTLANAVRFLGMANPDFSKGTRIETAAARGSRRHGRRHPPEPPFDRALALAAAPITRRCSRRR